MGLTEEQKRERQLTTQNITTFDSVGEDDYVFISYKSDEWEVVLDKVVRHMVDNYGLRVYFDKNFERDNDSWVKNMKSAITTRKCRAILAFVSKEYLTSYACVMELLTARSKQACMSYKDERYPTLQIIPIIIDKSGSIQNVMSKSGKLVYIKEEEAYLEILKNAKESPWVCNNKKLMPWLDRLAERHERTEENFSSVAEIILSEGYERSFSINNNESIFYERLRETIETCSKDVFDPSLIEKGTAISEDADAVSGVSHLKYWTEFRAYAAQKGLNAGLRLSEAADHNWYAIYMGSAIFRFECSVNTRKETLRVAFFVQNNPNRFIRLEQAKTAIEAVMKNVGEIVWDGESKAANVSVIISRKGKNTEEQYEWFCQTVEKLYAAVSPYLDR